MGCDIHSFVEKWDGQRWIWLDGNLFDNSYPSKPWEPFPGRSYVLFAMLADVRQESPPIPVIHEVRGFPSDVSVEVRKAMSAMPCDNAHAHSYLCYDSTFYSHSWATAAELLDYDMSHPYVSQWGETLHDVLGDYTKRFEQIAALADDPNRVRVVYAFDS